MDRLSTYVEKGNAPLFTNFGKFLYGMNSPMYTYDGLRQRPTLVLGSTGSGKTEFLLSLAFADACKGRMVVFVDGKCEVETLHKLYYYTSVIARRPFYALLPFQDMDNLSYSWNPLISTTLPVGIVAESFFNAYKDPGQQVVTDAAFYGEYQRNFFTKLMRALYTSGYAYNTQDIQQLISYDEIFVKLHPKLNQAGGNYYMDLMRSKRDDKRKFHDFMLGFTNHLKMFEHWTLQSYNPTIQFDRMLQTDSVVYVGLPVNSQPYLMGAIGNIIVNQLKSLSAHVQTQSKTQRRCVSCIIDEAGSFVDGGLAEWICKVRSSGFMLALGIQVLANLAGRRPSFEEEIRSNTPNVIMFNPQNGNTAKWFSELSGQQQRRSVSASIEGAAEGETGVGTARAEAGNRIPIDSMLSLRVGQFFYRPAEVVERPYLLTAPYLPDPPDRDDCRYSRVAHEDKQEMRGLHLSYHIAQERTRNTGAGE